jgi:uncharacterized membrane protein
VRQIQWPWIPFAFFAIAVGLYPLIYYFIDIHSFGLLQSKPKEVLGMGTYIPLFYVHVTCGGIALLTGWTQFSQRLRSRYMRWHRLAGKVYVVAVLLSSTAGLFIAMFASGGLVSVMGFGMLALLWLFTDVVAYMRIRRLDIVQHEKWMIRNYALSFAAVTLRIYLPLSQAVFHMDFMTAYRVISWLCWVPNLVIAEWIVTRGLTRSRI